MSDIKSALHAALFRAPTHVQTVVQKTINEWDEEGEKHFPINNPSVPAPVQTKTRLNNVMRETFAFIKNNPGLKSVEIMERMERLGFKGSSAASVASQLVREGQAKRKDGRYYMVAQEYTPIKQPPKAKVAALQKRVAALKEVAKSKGIADLPVEQPVQGLAALAATPAHATQEPLKPKRFAMLTTPQSPEHIVQHMNAYQARELYEHLKQIFGS